MRTKVEADKRAKTKPISLYPQQIKFATRRSLGFNISMSRYIQRLLEYDRENNVMANILEQDARNARTK